MVAAASRQDRQHLQRAVLDHQLEGAGEQEVADQHRRLVAEHGVGGGQAAAQLALIHHIVVQQGGGVDELDAGGQLHMAVAAEIAAQPGGGEGQQRAQALAAGRHDMRGELGDQRHGAGHARHDGLAAGIHIGLQQGEQRGQRVPLRLFGRLDGR